MLPIPRLRGLIFLPFLALLAGCQSDGPLPGASKAGFKANYLVARTALEQGKFGKAERNYASLLKKSGPLQPRIRLEYAHALLRSGKFDKASEQARIASTQLKGRGRSAALAVQATADQEIARKVINSGIRQAEAVRRLVAARSSFDEVLANHPDLDPLGSLALRRKSLDVELTTIN